MWIKSTSFNVWVRYFVWNFKGTLWNSTQNISPIHWKIWLDLRAHKCFWNAPQSAKWINIPLYLKTDPKSAYPSVKWIEWSVFQKTVQQYQFQPFLFLAVRGPKLSQWSPQVNHFWRLTPQVYTLSLKSIKLTCHWKWQLYIKSNLEELNLEEQV